ncbi:type IV fimbrial biogenesis protein FimT [Luteibacter sp. Sphag1AF]|uniref:GspH/FimT family pseudopilin n=1 Tax=Luteibacter sp. Sphag1AF TaxID=2587031 RepID=UPI00161E1C45|nr:GspH/FimT family pseudopilin [Luteibacter sp. Sphag1AF]MBB3229132.1 type IV fimbrial biogenesis protein FimT [Luteibacter sp. Sphag1AF]
MAGLRVRAKGFSIVELMVAVAVMGILLAIAVPSFRSTMRRSNVSNVANTLMGDIQYARGEAATRHKFVSICRSTDGATCAQTSADYDLGWLVYAYNAGTVGANQAYSASDSSFQLLRIGTVQKRVSITATDGKVMTFGQSGQMAANGTRTTNAFVLCSRKNGVDTGIGENVNEVPGSVITVTASGSVSSNTLVAGAACSP